MTGQDMGRAMADRMGCVMIMLLVAAAFGGICVWEFGWWVGRHLHVLWS